MSASGTDMPYDLAAEQAVLSGMLTSAAAIDEVAEILAPSDFYRPAHQVIAHAIIAMRAAGEPADPITIKNKLERDGDLSKVGHADYLHTLFASVPTAANAGYHARIVRDLAERRRFLEKTLALSRKAADPSVSIGDLRELARKTAEDPAKNGAQAKDTELLAGVRTGDWLSSQAFPELRYAVDGLIPEGLTILIGPPKAGKSWLALDLLLAVTSGGLALGHIKTATSRRALYLALEDGDRRMQDRCRALLGPDESIPAEFAYQTRILPGAVLATIGAWMRRYPDTAMVVVDTLGKVMPPALQGESAYQRDYRVGSALKALADDHPGLAVVVLHHDRKATSDDFVDSVSGTHGLAGAADTIVVLSRKRQALDGSLKVTGRDVPENEYALVLAGGKAWQLDGDTLAAAAARVRQREDERDLGEVTTRVLAAVQAAPAGVRAGDLAATFGKDVYQYLKRLTDAGRIDKLSRGLYVAVSEPSEPSETSSSHSSDTSDGSDTHEGWPENGGRAA